MAKKALITGVTGQDGAYLARFLLDKGYEVHGMRRMASVLNTERISHLIASPQDGLPGLNLHYGDMTDSSTLIHLVQRIQPDEIYNLAAQSHVRVSFDTPEYTANADGLGTLRLLEAMRILGLERHTRFYQASTSELFGKAQEPVQTETTPFYPRSPYAVAKLYAYWITVNYREAYGMYACNGILFNHESPIRGHSFVTRKITRGLARILVGLQDALYMGNLEARRDWGHARDYVEMQWLMLQQDTPEDYVIATGKDYSVRQVVEMACGEAGITLAWSGNGLEETGRIETLDRSRAGALLKDTPLCVKEGDPIIRIDRYYFRPTEVDTLLGNPAKAKARLGWEPRISVQEMIREMMASDAEQAVRDVHLESVGFRAIGLPEHV